MRKLRSAIRSGTRGAGGVPRAFGGRQTITTSGNAVVPLSRRGNEPRRQTHNASGTASGAGTGAGAAAYDVAAIMARARAVLESASEAPPAQSSQQSASKAPPAQSSQQSASKAPPAQSSKQSASGQHAHPVVGAGTAPGPGTPASVSTSSGTVPTNDGNTVDPALVRLASKATAGAAPLAATSSAVPTGLGRLDGLLARMKKVAERGGVPEAGASHGNATSAPTGNTGLT